MTGFEHEGQPQRVVFDAGRARSRVAGEVERLGSERVMLIASERVAEVASMIAGGLPVALRHDDVVMHVPVEVAARARVTATEHGVDAVVCVGGGSTTGLAKAVALTTGLPIVAVPTTYAGSEATNVWGMTEDGRKTTGVDAKVLPTAVVYDAELVMSLPVELSIASGLNALAHCVDAMWGPRVDPIDQALAAEGIRALDTGLREVVADPADVSGRERTLYGAYLSAVAFACAGSGLHHKVCHVLGGMFDLPHAQTHAVVLPHVLAFNAPDAPGPERRIAASFGADTAVAGLARLRADLDAPVALRDYGLPEDALDAAVDAVLEVVPDNNPTVVTRDNLAALLHDAWAGEDAWAGDVA